LEPEAFHQDSCGKALSQGWNLGDGFGHQTVFLTQPYLSVRRTWICELYLLIGFLSESEVESTYTKQHMVMNKAQLIFCLGRVPLVGSALRWFARQYPEGSVVTIKNGPLAGYKWKRSHKYVSGYWLGIYELPIQECLAHELQSGDVFYDIGGNAGFFSLLGAICVGDSGQVFTFEPLPENIEAIRSQFKLNRASNCALVEAAVSDCVGEIEFCEGTYTSTAHIKRHENGQGEVKVVKTITLDEFAKTESPPDFVKIDVEGAEIMALRGAHEILQSECPPKFMIEFHGQDLAEEGRSLLGKFGYRFVSLDGLSIDSSPLPRHVLAVPPGETTTK